MENDSTELLSSQSPEDSVLTAYEELTDAAREFTQKLNFLDATWYKDAVSTKTQNRVEYRLIDNVSGYPIIAFMKVGENTAIPLKFAVHVKNRILDQPLYEQAKLSAEAVFAMDAERFFVVLEEARKALAEKWDAAERLNEYFAFSLVYRFPLEEVVKSSPALLESEYHLDASRRSRLLIRSQIYELMKLSQHTESLEELEQWAELPEDWKSKLIAGN